jgi:hypothetical protein
MKKTKILILIFLGIIVSASAQEKDSRLVYRIGGGPGIEGNIGKVALNFSNELSIFFHDRISINPSITYFVSVADTDGWPNTREKRSEEENEFSSSMFTDVKFQFDLIKTKNDFRLGVAAGPSFQLGGDATFRGYATNESNELVPLGYEVNKYRRLGYVTQLSFDWERSESQKKLRWSEHVFIWRILALLPDDVLQKRNSPEVKHNYRNQQIQNPKASAGYFWFSILNLTQTRLSLANI